MISIEKGMPIDNPELGLLLDEINTIKRYGVDGLELPWEKVEQYNIIMDMIEKREGNG